ncbi:prolyl oligopeptidase family serine peptidase [Mucilaginibacter sp.]|jgi:dipeptidyl aminopeptidase/acylaminoacyl peptidase|uniref:S9 family peptidase n=1 Tax=Mucilaginibacter sp. TaxID=1882438 RepID=UPI003562DBFA
MKKLIIYGVVLIVSLLKNPVLFAQGYSMEDVVNYPFPRDVTSASTGAKFAMTIQEQGRRNIYVAGGPTFILHKLTNYQQDDGQEITSLSISANGKWVVYVRGGEHSGNRDRSRVVNAASAPVLPLIQVWCVPFAGGVPKLLSEGDYPVISPGSDRVAFIKDGQIWMVPINGLKPAGLVVNAYGESSDLQWSPDGLKLAFVSNRTDHSFIGIYKNSLTPIKWVAPSFSKDVSPRWSPDGKRIAFIRTPGSDAVAPTRQGANVASNTPPAATPQSTNSAARIQPWAIWIADVTTDDGSLLWKSPETMLGSIPTTDGATNLNWAAGNRIVFVSYLDGWPHLYSINSTGGTPLLLTPGNFMAEEIRLSDDGKWLVFSANTGPDQQLDIDRRHIARVAVDKPGAEVLTTGNNLETYPALSGDGTIMAMFVAGTQCPLLPAIMPLATKKIKLIGAHLLPAKFPLNQMVIPKQVVYQSPDGTMVHAQLFESVGGKVKKPAIVYVHGGPQRQMLLGWHHMDYYAVDYAMNQYLASRGFVVLAVNYRQGIGYGYDFHKPVKPGANYMDVKAGGTWLATQPWVDTARIGIYGGSAGGALTASALARDSKLFKAGVIIHGNTPEPLDAWTSPTLVIHGDDDRNVAFSAGVSLIKRFEIKGSSYFEYLVIPDDSHHWMKHENVLKVNKAVAAFLTKQLMK